MLSRREFTVSVLAAAAGATRVASAAGAWPQAARNAAAPATAASDALAALTLAEASARIRAGTVTSTELVHRLPRAHRHLQSQGQRLHHRHARRSARAGEDPRRRAARRQLRGPLHGIPIALKDNIDTAGVRTTAASAVFDDRVPTEDAEVARRLAAAGAVVVGKANLHEFAFGGTSATSYYGPVRNPWALERNPGGSSGGSAAAVATELCYAALGTDTGGSIRTPASYCSVVGLKPTYGLVSIRGIIPLTVSLDHCGPLTRTVTDAAMMLNVLAGYDRLDIASVEHPAEDYVAALKQPIDGFRIGIPRAPFFDLVDADVARLVDEALRVVAGLTRGMKDTMLPADARHRAGRRDLRLPRGEHRPRARTLHDPDAAGAAKRRQRKAGEYVRSRWRLELLRRTIDDAFRDVDLVVLPTRRRTPRTVDASIKREETDVPRNPRARKHQRLQCLRHPGHFHPVWLHLERSAGRADDRGAAVFGRQSPRAGARVRAGDRLPYQAATDSSLTRRCRRSPRLKIPLIRAAHKTSSVP
jgi:aspartyl-tRNA(Asn)/glutamyl-tRNA(Gln) amidotransferase subunit A